MYLAEKLVKKYMLLDNGDIRIFERKGISLNVYEYGTISGGISVNDPIVSIISRYDVGENDIVFIASKCKETNIDTFIRDMHGEGYTYQDGEELAIEVSKWLFKMYYNSGTYAVPEFLTKLDIRPIMGSTEKFEGLASEVHKMCNSEDNYYAIGLNVSIKEHVSRCLSQETDTDDCMYDCIDANEYIENFIELCKKNGYSCLID